MNGNTVKLILDDEFGEIMEMLFERYAVYGENTDKKSSSVHEDPNPKRNNDVSPIQVLYDHYSESNSGSSQEILALTRELRSKLDEMNKEQADELFETIAILCSAHEQNGFYGGVRMGIRIMNEVT